MNYTQEERQIAQNLCKSKETVALLAKVFCPDRSVVRAELERNIATLPDEEYGRQMKILVASEQHFMNALSVLQQLGAHAEGKSSSVALR